MLYGLVQEFSDLDSTDFAQNREDLPMGKIKDFFTKIGVADGEADDGFLEKATEEKPSEPTAREPEPPQAASPLAAATEGLPPNLGQKTEVHAAGFGKSSKVVNIGATAGSIRESNNSLHGVNAQANNNMKVVVIQPRSLDDSQQIANCLKEKRPVVINFEGVDDQLYRRILDFVSGTTYALDGSVNSISSRVWLFSPKNVNVSVSKQGNSKPEEMPWEKK